MPPLLLLLLSIIRPTFSTKIDFTKCGSKDTILFDVKEINGSSSVVEKTRTYELDLLASISEGIVNTSEYQIFVDIELEGFGLQQSMLPKLICDVAEPDPSLPRCLFNDTIRMKLDHTYEDALGSGIYKVRIRATSLTRKVRMSTQQCLDTNFREGDGGGGPVR